MDDDCSLATHTYTHTKHFICSILDNVWHNTTTHSNIHVMKITKVWSLLGPSLFYIITSLSRLYRDLFNTYHVGFV